MYTDTEAVVLRQTKTLNGRRMITIFSQKYGKIGAGTSISEKGKNKSALALRPFCYGRYELFKGREMFNIQGAEVIESFYSLGEDVDKYFAASYALEFTDQILPDDVPNPELFALLLDFLKLLQGRRTAFDTPVIAYQLKALDIFGSGVGLDMCMRTEEPVVLKDPQEGAPGPYLFSVEDGGLISRETLTEADALNPLIFDIDTGIIKMMGYMLRHPITALEKLAIPEGPAAKLRKILSSYISFHLGIDRLRSEGLNIN